MPTTKRVPLGKPLPPVDNVLLSVQEEIDLAVSNWNTYAPAKYRGMLEARPLGTDDKKARWFYDEQRGRYVSRSGYVVSPRELRKAYLAYQKAINKK